MIQRLIFIGVLLLVAPMAAPASFAAGLPHDSLLVETASSQYRFDVEIADEPAERAEGLMYRQSLADNAGMLFLYPSPQPVEFWMKNTVLPLDIVFVRANGTIARIAADTRPMSESLIPSGEPVVAVLEVKAGTMHALGITVGDRLRNPKYFP
jgi:uncharacterized membrane protein (UPF0127 family)